MNNSLDMLDTLQDILRSCSPETRFSVDASLVAQGLGSLAATRFVLEVQARFGVPVSVDDLGAGMTLAALADTLANARCDDAARASAPASDVLGGRAGMPLLPLQQAFLVTADPDYSADPAGCHLYREFDVTGIDADALASGWTRLVAQQPMLSVRLADDGTLVPGADVPLDMDRVTDDAHDGALAARRDAWWARVGRMPARPVAIAIVSSPGRVSLQMSLDAIVLDGFGLQLLLRQWLSLATGRGLPPPAVTPAECVNLLGGSPPRASLDYWRGVLADAPPGPFVSPVTTALAERRAASDSPVPFARRGIEASLPPAIWQRLKRTAERFGISPTSLVFAAFAEVVLEIDRAGAASFVMTTSERSRLPLAAQDVIGPFTSSMVVPVARDAHESTDAFAVRLHREVWTHLAHGAVPAVIALRESPASAATRGLPVVFTSLLGIEVHAQAALHERAASCQTSGVALEHQMWEADGALRLHWDVTDAMLPPGVAGLCLDRLLARLSAVGASASAGAALNRLQQAYFVGRSETLNAESCCAVFSFDAGGLDRARVEAAWRELVAATPALRSHVGTDGAVRIHAADDIVAGLGVTEVDEAALTRHGEALEQALLTLPFPPGRWPLQQAHLLTTPGGGVLYVCFDLLMLDASSIHGLVASLAARLSGGAGAPVRDAAAEAAWPGVTMRDGYWPARMRALAAGPDRIVDTVPRAPWTRIEAAFAGYDAFREACRLAGVDVDDVLVAAMAAAWRPESACPFTLPVVCCRPQDDRQRPGEASQIAWLSFADGSQPGAIDLRAPLPKLARAIRQCRVDDLAHGGIEGLGALSVRNAQAGEPLALPVVYTGIVEWGRVDERVANTLRWRTATPGISVDAVGLSVNDRLLIGWDCRESDFAPDAARRAFERYRAALARMLADPRVLGGAIALPASPLRPVHLAFEQAAAARPDAPAVHWRDGEPWTFRRLNRRANAIARRLRELGAGPGATVAISIPRTPALIAATLGVLKAGAAYVPVEPSLPAARAARMIEVADCRLALVLSTRPADATLPEQARCVAVDALPDGPDDDRNPDVINDVDSLAYVIFTSGSTGEPKGVTVSHRPLLNLFDWCQRRYRFGSDDLGVCVTSLGFDLSVFDILGLLGYGAALYLAGEAEQRDPALLAAILTDYPVTFWNSAPTTLDQVSRHFDDLPAGAARGALRLVFLSGDYTPLALPPVLSAAFPRARLVSLGGATEATVWSNFHEVCEIDPGWRSIPYGRPIDNARYYILDEAGEPCGPGVEGALFIGGEVLSLGYYRRPELTAERFVRDPFVADATARMYRTGDRASFYPDGSMSFCGRVDRQVKVRGVRIELEEIEHALRQYPRVREAVVMVRPDPSGDAKIVAYVDSEAELDPRALRAFSQSALPASMVPNFVHVMHGFPATSNGKLDRQALPWPLPLPESAVEARVGAEVGAVDAVAQSVVAAPDLATLSSKLGQLFARFLGREPDPARELWEQGATSFTMVQASGALRAEYGVRLQVEWLTRDPSVAGIARMLHSHLAAAALVAPSAPVTVPASPAVATRPSEPARPADDARVDVLDPVAKQAFLDAAHNRRLDLDGQARAPLPPVELPQSWFAWRGARRDFADGIVSTAQLGRLLGLLASRRTGSRDARLYPSAGDTYAVQIYVWLDAGRVDGFDAGYYWFDSAAAALVRVGRVTAFAREAQFIYNRPLRDRAAMAMFLVGEPRAIAPLYGLDAERFLLLEAGYIGQLLMLGQHESGLGLCPIGSFNTADVQANLQLHSGQTVLHSFLLGPVAYAPASEVPAPLRIACEAVGRRRAPVSIVGHALRYPGAATPDAFWALLSNGERALREAPRRHGTGSYHRLAGGWFDRIDGFDALAFSIAPNDAAQLDPQTRMLLEVVRECLERAGHDARSLQQTSERVGVFAGHLWQDYRQYGVGAAGRLAATTASGSEIAHRISAVFGFTGPSIAIDTACSSGLSALHLACTALANGDCDSAIVCAANLIAHPSHIDALNALGFVAARVPAGAFDGDTTGWVIGEGAGALLLRRADAADAHADRILAQILGTHLEQSGARAAYGSPSESAIEAGLRAVLRRASLESGEIDYVECAVAGGPVSDAAEWQALARVFPDGVLAGTVKPNIGHLEAASGLSQLSKVLLQLEYGMLAPTLVAPSSSPLVELDAGPVRMVRGLMALPARRSVPHLLINAVGSTGASAQVILAAPPARARAAAQGPSVLLLSAASVARLEALAQAWLAALETARDVEPWEGVCGTSQLARAHGEYRLAIEADDRDEAIERLRVYLRGGSDSRVHAGRAAADQYGVAMQASEFRGALRDWLAGHTVEWRAFWSAVPHRVPLPTSPFARETYWLDAPTSAPARPQTDAFEPDWRARLRTAFATASGIAEPSLNDHVALERYGLNSRIATEVIAELSRAAPLPATLLYECRDLAAAAARLAEFGAPVSGADGPRVPPRTAEHDTARAVAVIGIAGRYPGAADVDTLWKRLVAGADLVGGLPPHRVRDIPGHAHLMQGAFLDDVAGFDPFVFGIAPHDAHRMDPQERVLLEIVWHALEDACLPPSRLRAEFDGEVGVFIGAMHNDYALLGIEVGTPARLVDAGATLAGMANRISYHLDLHGPSLTVDTMCSSSLTAMQLAIEALRAGRIRLAIVGSASLALHPNKFVQQARMGMTASDGRCRSFGLGGDGFIPGEGAGVVILRLRDDAQRAGDRVHGVVLGCAVNHGGKVNGYTVPNPQAQAALVRASLDDAGIAADTVSYVEAHGTGTALGDPIETRALEVALSLAQVPAPLAIGSVKSNLGHLDAAAGIAGLTKVLLQMRHKTLAPSLHATAGNPDIDWRRFVVPQTPQPWLPRSDDGRAVWRAGVSAFGAGGSNAHVVLEAAPDPTRAAPDVAGPHLLVLSAATDDALRLMAGRLTAFLARRDHETPSLARVAATLQAGREPLRERWAVPCDDIDSAIALLRAFADGEAVGVRGQAVPQAASCEAGLPPDALARAWVSGQHVDWPRPAAWVELPGYPFTRMRCWIDRVDDGAAPPAPPVPLAERVWRPAGDSPPAASGHDDGAVLCLTGTATRGLADALAVRLAPRRVRVQEAADIGTRERPTTVLILSDLETGGGWQLAFEVCAALARGSAVAPLRIVQVVSGLHGPSAEPGPGSGAELAGLLDALAAEQRGTTCSVIDVGPVALGERAACEALAAVLAAEIARPSMGDICLTPLGRLVPAWQPVDRALPSWRPRADRAYAVTGGTRGIGARLALELVRCGARHIALLGRTRTAETDALVDALERQGARVVVHYASVEDEVATGHWLTAIDRELGRLDGVFHCAGVSARGHVALVDRSVDAIADVLAPKAGGVAALLRGVAAAPPDFIVLFSSISAVLNAVGAGVGDYSAANRAMDRLAEQWQRRGFPQVKSIAWPTWRDSQADASATAAMQRHGLPLLSDAEAFDILWRTIALSGSARYCPIDAALLVFGPVAEAHSGVEASVQAPPDAAAPMHEAGARALDWLREVLAKRTGLPIKRIPASASFAELGVESIMLGRLVEDIEARIGQPLAPGLLLEHPTVDALGAYFFATGIAARNESHGHGDGRSTAAPANLAASIPSAGAGASRTARADPPASPSAQTPSAAPDRDAVAVVGLAVRLPGAPDVDAFWRLLTDGRCAVTEVPAGRWDTAALFDPAGAAGFSVSRWGGFVDDIETFDPDYFGLDEDEALALDPAIRLFMEVALGCLADSGREPADVGRSNTGVFVGARMGRYGQRVEHAGLDAGLGGDQNFIAAHLAHFLDLRGANMVIDSACSSSLSALHQACQTILSGDAELAFAGGVDVLLDEEVYVQFTRAGALSPTGRCRTFDRHADGFVPGEGCAVFLLKKLSRALADGDRIRAVIEASAINNDGRTMGLTTPNPDAQKDVIRAALARAGRSPGEIGMVETHGTATMIGDPIELKALNDAYRHGTDQRGYCAVASVKSNLGHLLSAAGAAGLAKAVLAVEHGRVPPTLFCDAPNPRFDLAHSPFFIPSECAAWPLPGPRVAGVSAFGLGGSNAHVIVGEAPAHAAVRRPLAPPVLRRRRLWLERDGQRSSAPPPDPSSSPEVARAAAPSSLLSLHFEDALGDAASYPKLTTS
ncbi:amino acid adenylation domain-containing protein [Verminephrobacter aporrectodeae subsp. tuberculatae]|uniref:amino acid adenylation domain-containing protein n=1 Tax=Verminephrobacter aporrectodeae TaxID=1110389 RepID=UPI0022445014|nr:amino acid adenylation domain-containing protein [Verminephrobacter aporrectodeae]MCW8200045.1 amino acid adenylation domain-containing protein [Verminephrobacter aporrectodeae subsp. tuberculatae]